MSDPMYCTRKMLGLRNSKATNPLPLPVDTVFLHHTVTQGSFPVIEWRAVQDHHMDTRGYTDIAYHAGIPDDGRVFEGRPPMMDGAATAGWNNQSLAIAFIGDYTKRHPTLKQITSAAWLIQYWIKLGFLVENPRILGHKEVGATACPGTVLDFKPWINDLVNGITEMSEGEEGMRYLIKHENHDECFLVTESRTVHLSWEEWITMGGEKNKPNMAQSVINPKLELPVIVTADEDRYMRLIREAQTAEGVQD